MPVHLLAPCRKKGRRAADSDSDYSLSEGGDEGGSPAPSAPPPPPAVAAEGDGGPLSGEDSEDERARADQELSDDDDLRDADGQVANRPCLQPVVVRCHRTVGRGDDLFSGSAAQLSLLAVVSTQPP